jgi:hypothetical protein
MGKSCRATWAITLRSTTSGGARRRRRGLSPEEVEEASQQSRMAPLEAQKGEALAAVRQAAGPGGASAPWASARAAGRVARAEPAGGAGAGAEGGRLPGVPSGPPPAQRPVDAAEAGLDAPSPALPHFRQSVLPDRKSVVEQC